jgi:hypothetical protein
MNIRPIRQALMVAAGLLLLTGCATVEKGRTQKVTLRSVPSGATVVINNIEVGRTPLRVEFSRRDGYAIEVKKTGFTNGYAVLLPSSKSYDKRFLKWGFDYATGASNDLLPGDITVGLRPSMVPASKPADAFSEMAANITQADAMLASGEISPADHRYVVAQIVDFYSH